MRFMIGVDEVGRGSLAGPVTVAVVCMPRSLRIRSSKLGGLRDSKKLTPKQRSEWFEHLSTHPKIFFAVARVYPRAIERVNISNAANLAAARAFGRLLKKQGIVASGCRIYLDGGLYLGKKGRVPGAKTIVKGDEKVTAVKAASILAKVLRDRFMVKLAKKYPLYGFDLHKGYATRAHREAVEKWGPSDIHRLTFLKNYSIIHSN
jgi:ribonuclease HII